jgi:hypothetical protein
MISEFTVGPSAPGTIRAPNTGDGGLLESGGTGLTSAGMLALAGLALTAGAATWLWSRKAI